MLTGYDQHEQAVRSFKAGAKGFVSKAGHAFEPDLAVAAVAKGGMFVSPTVAEEFVSYRLNGHSLALPNEQLQTS